MKKFFLTLMIFAKVSIFGFTWIETPTTLSSPLVNAGEPVIRTDSAGNLIVMWIEGGLVKSSKRAVNGEWTLPATDIGSEGASSLNAVLDSSGNATALWIQNGEIYTSSQAEGLTWSSPVAISASPAINPHLADDGNGNVVAIWERNGALESAFLPAGGSWNSSEILAEGPTDSSQISMNPAGKVCAVWHATENAVDTIYSSSRTISESWEVPRAVSNPTQNSVQPQVAIDYAGNILAIWYQYELQGSLYSNVAVQSAHYSVRDSQWESPITISPPGIMDPATLNIKIRYNAAGIGIAAWNNCYTNGLLTLQGRGFFSGNWQDLVTKVVTADPFAYDIDFEPANPSGYFFGIFTNSNTNVLGTQVNTCLINTFSSFANILARNTISVESVNRYPRAAATYINNQVLVGVAWLAYNGEFSIVQAGNGFGMPLFPPANLSVMQASNDFGLFTEYYNTISWEDPTIQKYNGYLVFKNGTLVDGGPTGIYQYVDRNVPMETPILYGIAYMLSNGDQSPISYVSYP